MSTFEQYDDIPKYRKKSTAKPPKKSKHKHLCEYCILEYPEDWWNKDTGKKRKMWPHIGVYCPICGKIGSVTDKERWHKLEKRTNEFHTYYESVHTEEYERELNPRTRTLPTFSVDDPFAKFVKLTTVEGENNE